MLSLLILTLITLTLSLSLNAVDSNHYSNPHVLDSNPNSKSSIPTLTRTLNALDSNPKGNRDPNPNPNPRFYEC